MTLLADPPHHYIEQITPAIESAAQWWGRALVRTNGLDPVYRGEIDRLFAQMFERQWRTGCDRDMCLWEEDMPPVIVTATPTPGFLLLSCMERIAAELQRDLRWRSRAHIEMTIGVERVWLRLDGEVENIWTARKS